MTTPIQPGPDFGSAAYRQAYARINGLVVVGEGMADQHFRRLARAIPDDAEELRRLGAMEGRHARELAGCGAHLGVHPDLALARQLVAPLHGLFQACDRQGDLPGCLVIQCLIVECFAVAAYTSYLPVADAYARPITAAVLADEDEHLSYGEQWLRRHFAAVEPAVQAITRQALPITLAILRAMVPDLRAIGIDPLELLGTFQQRFRQALETIGYGAGEAQALVWRSTLTAAA